MALSTYTRITIVEYSSVSLYLTYIIKFQKLINNNLFSDAQIVDPCSTHETLKDNTRSVSRDLGTRETEQCDRSLKDAWYLLQDPNPTDMPTECIDILKCGSTAPIWINGTLPKKMHEIKKMKGCKRGFLDTECCKDVIDIEVKNCGSFNVYHLTPLKDCYGRYCTVGAARCRPGTTSETGYEPCRRITITFPIKPKILPFIPTHDARSSDRQLAFKCYENYARYRVYYFDIKYLIDGDEISSKTENLTYNEVFSRGALRKSDWQTPTRKLGFKVKCLIRIKQTIGSLPSEWQESEEFYAGIKVLNPQVTVVAGNTADIQIVSTVPVACPQFGVRKLPCKLRFEMLDFKEEGNEGCNRTTVTQPSTCGLEIDGWNFNSPATISVSTLRNPRFQSDYSAIVRLQCRTSTSDELWKNLLVPDVKVLIRNPVTQSYYAHCMSNEDPNIHTSDGSFYSHHGLGEFVLYAHKTKPIAVHVIHHRWNSYLTVNCAVAIRAASDVFIIYGCERRNQWIVRRLNCRESKGAYLDIFERNEGREYEVHLPTGTRVLVKIISSGYIDIDVYPSTAELGNSHGLCGHFNGIQEDDFVGRNGNRLSQQAFKQEWSVNPIDSLFVAKSRKGQISSKYFHCQCIKDALTADGDLTSKADCSWKESYTLCQTKSWSPKRCEFRHRRDTSGLTEEDEDDELDVPEDKVRFEPPPADVNKWKNGWNESAATDYCTKILQKSEAFKKCNLLTHLSDRVSIDICVSDIKVSGTTQFSEHSTNAYKSSCVNEVRLNSTLAKVTAGNTGETLLESIVENDCPNDCMFEGKQRGNCVAGVCHCNSGYSGGDCSVDTNKPPDVLGTLKNSKCDINKTTCTEVPIYGTNFYKNGVLQCRLEEKDLNTTSNSSGTIIHLLAASMESFAEVRCPLPTSVHRRKRSTNLLSPKGFSISVTTNGNTFSNAVPVIVFDSSCSDCTISHGSIMSCKHKDNICVIQNTCYPLSNPICGHHVNNVEKTEGSKLWIVGAVLGGISLLVIVILITVKINAHKRAQTNTYNSGFSQDVYHAPKAPKYPN